MSKSQTPKLLIITQKVDKDDSVLGFFHRWIELFAQRWNKISIICLEKGTYDLPPNVDVYSLGKENFQFSIFNFQKLKYVWRFYKLIWKLRNDYDSVFVHMNQEYVLLTGDIWRLMGKRVYLWRNHAYGDFLTRLAVLFSHKVFYTSPSSFTARFRKAVKMPVGIDTNFFKPDPSVKRMPNSVLFLGRISPVKKVLEFLNWIIDTNYTATIAGPILPQDKVYGEKVLSRIKNQESRIKYVGPVDQDGALRLYQTHEIYVNKTPAGSFDKTILEAAACGMRLMVDNLDAKGVQVGDHSLSKLMERLEEEMK